MEAALNAALKIGYRHIDTAILYENENTIGKIVNKWIRDGKLKREDLFISTKLPPTGMYQERVEQYLNASLNNLQLDYVDLYLLHSPEGIRSVPANKDLLEMDTSVDHAAVWKVGTSSFVLPSLFLMVFFEETGGASESRSREVYWLIEL